MLINVSLHTAVVLTKSEDQLMLIHAVLVKTANGQYIFQTTRELSVLEDHSLNVTASANILKTDTHANNANMDKDKIQETLKDVSMLQDATKETKLSVSVTLKAATNAEHASFHKSQETIDQSAIDQDQLVNVPKDTPLMDTLVFHALMDKYLMMLDKLATQLHNVSDQERFLETDRTATDATLAQITLFQMTQELNVLDQSHNAHAQRDTLLMDTNAFNVQTDKSSIQTKTRDVSHKYATPDNKSSLPENTATDVILAHKVMNQTHKELSASESSQSAAALRSMTQVVMSVSHAQFTKLPPTETKDVSQDNAQDSTKFLELLILAMHAKNAKRDPPQTT
jgi:hypothetical protein